MPDWKPGVQTSFIGISSRNLSIGFIRVFYGSNHTVNITSFVFLSQLFNSLPCFAVLRPWVPCWREAVILSMVLFFIILHHGQQCLYSIPVLLRRFFYMNKCYILLNVLHVLRFHMIFPLESGNVSDEW